MSNRPYSVRYSAYFLSKSSCQFYYRIGLFLYKQRMIFKPLTVAELIKGRSALNGTRSFCTSLINARTWFWFWVRSVLSSPCHTKQRSSLTLLFHLRLGFQISIAGSFGQCSVCTCCVTMCPLVSLGNVPYVLVVLPCFLLFSPFYSP
jgi:hypothetical protein